MPHPSLAEAITEAPRAADPDLSRQRVATFADGLPARHRLLPLLDRPVVLALLRAVADHSPFLWRLAQREPDRLADLLERPPAVSLALCLDRLSAECRDAASPAAAMAPLRRARDDVALLVALADLGGAWPFEPVVEALTRFADRAVDVALDVLLREAETAGRLLPGDGPPGAGCGLAVLAMGKGGAGELNYSSDIDLVVFYDPAAPRLPPGAVPSQFYVRLTRGLVKLLSERTGDGYVLRVDLRLRPDPGSTGVAVSLPAAFTYYESFGQNWERAAYIKARPIAGDRALGARFLADLAPFIWRRYFD